MGYGYPPAEATLAFRLRSFLPLRVSRQEALRASGPRPRPRPPALALPRPCPRALDRQEGAHVVASSAGGEGRSGSVLGLRRLNPESMSPPRRRRLPCTHTRTLTHTHAHTGALPAAAAASLARKPSPPFLSQTPPGTLSLSLTRSPAQPRSRPPTLLPLLSLPLSSPYPTPCHPRARPPRLPLPDCLKNMTA